MIKHDSHTAIYHVTINSLDKVHSPFVCHLKHQSCLLYVRVATAEEVFFICVQS